MADNYVEEGRFLYLDSPSTGLDLMLVSFKGHEGISELFSFQLELLTEKADLHFEDILGASLSFGINGAEGDTKRHINGIVTAFSELPRQNRLYRYSAVVSPEIWKLTRIKRSRIFQNKSVVDILNEVLTGYSVEYQLQGTHNPRVYCVQYRETDFDFISRLMEEEGICYFFSHSVGSHKLVLSDTPSGHQDIPGVASIVYDPAGEDNRFEQRISDWRKTQRWDSGKYTLRDYCFQVPQKNLQASQDILATTQVGVVTHALKLKQNVDIMQVYDYPGGYAKTVEGGPSNALQKVFEDNEAAAKRGIGRIETAQFLIRGESDVHTFIPGYRFSLVRHFNGDGAYLITSVTHEAEEGSFASEGGVEATSSYRNIFTCIPFRIPYSPQCSTPKPQMRGCQTAFVVGQAGEEIYTDEYGRIKVQFHWDREGTADEKSSCWVRVASYWAGKKWGAFHLPRIGQEVLVDFLEGDPDQPIVVGSVYNAENMPPYSLPDNKTQSTLKSRSSKSGGADNFNEIRFEDKMGSEEVYFQAEKDLNSLVKNDETRKVKHDRKVTIEHDDSKDVTHDLKLTVGNDRTTKISHDDTATIGNDSKTTIAHDETATIGHDKSVTVGGKNTVTIAMDSSETIGGKQNVTVAQNQTVTIGGSESHTAVSRTTTIMGADSTTVAATVTITAAGGLTITSGGPVSITAPMITLTAPVVQAAGVIQCTTLIAAAGVVSPMYTPGAGNIF